MSTQFLFIMMDTPASDSEPNEIDLSVVVCLTFYKSGTAGKYKKKTMDIKAKTFYNSFSELKDNYLELLTAILEKDHVDKKYKVTAHNIYPCRIHPAKYVYFIIALSSQFQFLNYSVISRQCGTPDAVNNGEYKDLVKNTILSAPGGKLLLGIDKSGF